MRDGITVLEVVKDVHPAFSAAAQHPRPAPASFVSHPQLSLVQFALLVFLNILAAAIYIHALNAIISATIAQQQRLNELIANLMDVIVRMKDANGSAPVGVLPVGV